MPNYNGTLMIISNQSTLDNALLLMAEYPDPAQAMYEATRFLIKDRGLTSGQQIVVAGDAGTVGAVSIIVITDAHGVGAQPFAVTNLGLAATAGTPAKNAKKLRPATSKTAKKNRTVKAKAIKKDHSERG